LAHHASTRPPGGARPGGRLFWSPLLGVLFSILLLLGIPAPAASAPLPCDDAFRVGAGRPFQTIQAAVDALPNPGPAVICVDAGTYIEQVRFSGVNALATGEAHRIVLQADPAAPIGSVTLDGAVNSCTGGYAIRLQQSQFVTIQGLTITGAGGQAIELMGGNNDNADITIANNRITRNGSSECNGGITAARGNPRTWIVNNLIYANGRNGITFIDADGGPHFVVHNTIHRNGWSGVRVARSHTIWLLNNAITHNGQQAGSTGGRFGVSREGSTSPDPAGITLLNNLVCGNRLGEIDGPALDGSDAGNLTPTGQEQGSTASPSCANLAAVYANTAGPDGLLDTLDDDFHLTPTSSPAIDRGLASFVDTAGIQRIPAEDFAGDVRPREGNGTPPALPDLGAFEALFTIPGFTVTITEPAGGATVAEGDLLVRGTIQGGGAEVGVTVNEVIAAVDGNTFAALVPVNPATTTLTAVATTPIGASATSTITLTVTPTDPNLILRLQASPASGVAPLTVTFSVVGGPVPTAIDLDLQGDGSVDFSGPSLDGQTFTYLQPGLFVPTVRVTVANGNQFIARTVLQVLDQAALDALLQAKWTGMKDALRAGDIPGALTRIAFRSRSRYDEAFRAIAAQLPNIDTILTNAMLVEVRNGVATYQATRTDAGVDKVFDIRVVVDGDGIWRIEAF